MLKPRGSDQRVGGAPGAESPRARPASGRSSGSRKPLRRAGPGNEETRAVRGQGGGQLTVDQQRGSSPTSMRRTTMGCGLAKSDSRGLWKGREVPTTDP